MPIAECLESLIKEKIPLVEAIRRTGVLQNCPLEEIPPCSMSRAELDFFYKFARKFGGPVLEFGAYAGGSARAFWHGMDAKEDEFPEVYSVDLYHRWESDLEGLIQITANSRIYKHDEDWNIPLIGFEDCDHCRITTKENLKRLKMAGCQYLLVHDISEEKLKDAPMSLEHTSRAGALEWGEENPEFHLQEIMGGQGIFVFSHKDVQSL